MTDPVIDTRGLAKRYGRTTRWSACRCASRRARSSGSSARTARARRPRSSCSSGSPGRPPATARSSARRSATGRPAVGSGYLPELFRYQPWLRAREVLALHCALAGIESRERTAEIATALETVGLADRADDLVGAFSKGMQQRLGLGVALLGRPELVLLDEPTSALDPVGRADVRRIIRAARERGTTVFLNSHLLSEVERVCDRVAVVDHGRVVAAGTLEELLGEDSVRVHVTGLDPAARAGSSGSARWPTTAAGWRSNRSPRTGSRNSSRRSSPPVGASTPSSRGGRRSRSGSSAGPRDRAERTMSGLVSGHREHRPAHPVRGGSTADPVGADP